LAESQSAWLISADDPNAITHSRVIGQDSVQMTPYNNELHWLWGDTSRLSYPLGNFHSPSARTAIPGPEKWNPDSSIPIRYFTDKTSGFAAETCRMKGDGPTWASAMTTVRDSDGQEKLVCWFAKIKPPLETYQRGVAIWNDQLITFKTVRSSRQFRRVWDHFKPWTNTNPAPYRALAFLNQKGYLKELRIV
jgi:hypothetical protein